MAFFFDEAVFREVKAHVRVIECQKRRLSHAHWVLFLAPQSKVALLQTNSADALISAEIPSMNNLSLPQVILKHNTHNPFVELYSSAVCMKEKACTKPFPRKFVDETGHGDSHLYMAYRRRTPNRVRGMASRNYCTVHRSSLETKADGSWLVPYSPRLSVMFQCHLNLELCLSRVEEIEFLFKYVCKGCDRVTVQLVHGEQHNDKIGQFRNAWYVSPSKAIWLLLQFETIN